MLENLKRQPAKLAGVFVAILTFALYASTMAQGLILGDPTEYTIVAHILGIAHPPGYAFMTVMGKLIQTLVPFGSIAWRSHLLNTLVGTLIVVTVYNVVLLICGRKLWGILAAVFAALSVAWGPNHWQHSIHANPHLITAGFLIINVWLLLLWSKAHNGALSTFHLLLFCFLTGLGAVHHPLTVFSFPAFTLYILLVHPRIVFDWRLLLKMVGCAVLGLSLFAYYPIVSSLEPQMGPSTMNTVQGFLDHVLARGLSDSLPYYSLAEQPIRLTVFWSILRMQFGVIGGLLAILGAVTAVYRKEMRKPAVLLLVAFLMNYGFVISLKQQDIMAYIMGPNLLVGVFIGIGVFGLAQLALSLKFEVRKFKHDFLLLTSYSLLALLGPMWALTVTWPHVSLRNFSEGDEHVAATFETFDGQGDGVVLLNNWEFMTPLWYAQMVENRWPDESDVRPVFVSAAEPWLPSVFNHLPGGPVYLNGYRREIVQAGFRLRPRGDFYQVVEPNDQSIPEELMQVSMTGEGPKLVGYRFEDERVNAGDYVPLVLAMRLDEKTADFYAPSLKLMGPNGTLDLPFTTDSHLVTPLWEAGEVIVEDYYFAIPHDFPAGEYAVSLNMVNLSRNGETGEGVNMGSLTVEPNDGYAPSADGLLANFRQRVGLTQLTARSGFDRRQAPWDEPLAVERGEVVIVTPKWRALDSAEESYTIFVHLIDAGNMSHANLDYTPLGGAVPTHLWFPKWLPGQEMADPYRLVIPDDLAPGSYQIEVGLYEMTSQRRLAMHDQNGNQIGDRYIAGSIEVR